MKVNFDSIICNLNGEAMRVPDGAADLVDGVRPTKNATLAFICVEALLWYDPSNPGMDTGEQKAHCGALAARLYQGGTQEITVEDAALIKRKVGANIASPLVVAAAYSLLEQRIPGEA